MTTTETAADWWAKQLRGPARQDVGYASGEFVRTLLTFHNEPLSEEQVAAFRAALIPLIDGARDQWGECTLSVDYEPDDLLLEAGEVAGVDLNMRLPAKTVMWITPARVQVRCGYGAEVVTL